MSAILDTLTRQLDGGTIDQLSRAIGADPATTSKAVSAALPVLLGAMAKNAANRRGAEELDGALERDHDGGLLDDLQGFLGGASTSPGESILRHVLGERQQPAEQGLGQFAGLDPRSAGKLMALLAPIVMGVLGREKRRRSLDAPTLAGVLQQEQARARRAAPSGLGMLGQILDADGDGSIADDVGRMGAGLLGKWMKR